MNDQADWEARIRRWKFVRVVGLGALIAGAISVAVWLVIAALLIGPLMFWFAWNVLDFGPALGLPELGLWAILLATLFLVIGWFGKVLLTGVVFVVDPSWLHGDAVVAWPEPTLKNFIAVALLAVLAASPHAREHKPDERSAVKRRLPVGSR